MWLIHRGGYSRCHLVSTETDDLPEGRCKVKLEQGGDVLEVDENDLDKVSNSCGRSFCVRGQRAKIC